MKLSILNSFKIKHRIFSLTFVAITAFAVSLLMNNFVVKENTLRISELQTVLYPALNLATLNEGLLIQLEQSIQTVVITGDEDSLVISENINKQIKGNLDKLITLVPNKNNDISIISQELKQYHILAKSLVNEFLKEDADFSTIQQQAAENARRFEQITLNVSLLHKHLESQMNENLATTVTSSNAAINTMFQVTLCASILLLIAGVMVNKSIINTLDDVTLSLQNIAAGEGDLTARIEYNGEDEIKVLVYWFNQFVEKLQVSFSDTKDTIATLTDASQQLTDSGLHSSVTVDEQNASIAQISEAMREMSITVASVAEFAASAAAEAEHAAGESQQGQVVVKDAIVTINKLAEEVQTTAVVIEQLEVFTRNAGAILDTIRSIAEQTNLLALNAAIEAARAGEQGRGFAVVADEVRTLASRTQASTEEIQAVLQELQTTSKQAVDATQRGIAIANESVTSTALAGDALTSINDKVNAIKVVNEQIATATEEQHCTSELIQQYVNTIEINARKVSKNNRVITGISSGIETVSLQLQQITNQFKV